MWDLVKRNLLRDRTQLGRTRRASVQLKHNEIVEAFLKAGRQKVPRSSSGRLSSVDSVAGEGGRTRAVRGGIWRAVSKVGLAIAMAIRLLNPYVLISVAFGQHRSLLAHFSARVDSMRAVLSPRIGRRRRLTAWIQDTLPHRQITEAASAVWQDGSLLCGIVEATVPGSCPGYDSLSHPNTDRSATFWLGQKLVARYLGVPPAFADEDIVQPYLTVTMERRMLRYLAAVKTASARVEIERQRRLRAIKGTDRGYDLEDAYSVDNIIQSSLQPGESLLECVARGMGLILGVQGRKSSFYLYLNPNHPHRHIHRLMQLSHLSDSGSSFEDEAGAILMQIRGPDGDFGAALISTSPGSCSATWGTSLTILNESWYGRIPIVYNTTSENVAISYVPQTPGRHELILLLRGGSHVPGSPFSVTVEESSEVPDDDGKRTRFGCEPIDDPSPLPSGMKKTKSHESGLEKTHRRTGSGSSDPGIDSKDEMVVSRKRKRVVARVVDFVNEKMLLTEDGKFEKLPKKRKACLTKTPKEEEVPEDQDKMPPLKPRRRYYSTFSSSHRMRHLNVNEPIHGTYPGRRSPIENGRMETTYGLSKSGFQGEVSMEVEDCEEAKRVREEEREKRERMVRVSDVASHHQTENISSTNFRDHCRRILWLCDILLEHSPRQESLEMLNTAGDILEGKRVHPTIMEESEPEDSTAQGASAARSSSAKGNSSSLNEQTPIQSFSSNTAAIAQRLQRTPSETGGLNEVSTWKDGRRQFHSWTRADKSGGSSGGRLLHKGGSYRGIVVRDMTAEPLTGACAGGDDLIEEDDETEFEVRKGSRRGEEIFIFDGSRLVSDKPHHSLPKRKTSKFAKLSENRGYSAETLEQITSSDPDKGCGRTTISGKGLNKSIAPKTKEPINYRDRKAERVNEGVEEGAPDGRKKLEQSKNEKESKNQANRLPGGKDGNSKDSEVKNITAMAAAATLKGEMREKEVSEEKILSRVGTKTVPWNDSAGRKGEKALQGEVSKGEPPPTKEHVGEFSVVEDEVEGETKEEVKEGLSEEVRYQDVETATGASVEAKAPGSATREINERLSPPPLEVPTLPPHTIHSSEKYPVIQGSKGAMSLDVSRGSASSGSGYRRMIPEEEIKVEEGVEVKEHVEECVPEEKFKNAPDEHEGNKTPLLDQSKQERAIEFEQGAKASQNESHHKTTIFRLDKEIEPKGTEKVKEGREEDTIAEEMGKISRIDRVEKDSENVIEEQGVITIHANDEDVKGTIRSGSMREEISKSEMESEAANEKREVSNENIKKGDGSIAHEGREIDNIRAYDAKKEIKYATEGSKMVHVEGIIENIKSDIDVNTGEEGEKHRESLVVGNEKDVERGIESVTLEKEKKVVGKEMGDSIKDNLKTLEQQDLGEGIKTEKNDELVEKARENEGHVGEKENANVEEEENLKEETEKVEEKVKDKMEEEAEKMDDKVDEESKKVEEEENVDQRNAKGNENERKTGKDAMPTNITEKNNNTTGKVGEDEAIGNVAKDDVETTEELKSVQNEEHTQVLTGTVSSVHDGKENNSKAIAGVEIRSEIEGEFSVKKTLFANEVIGENQGSGKKKEEGEENNDIPSAKTHGEKRRDNPWIPSANENEKPNEYPHERKREMEIELEATQDVKVEKRKSITYTELIGKLLCTDSFPPDSLEWFEDRLNELEEEELQGTMESMEKADTTAITGGCAVGDEVWEEPLTGGVFGLGSATSDDFEACRKGRSSFGGQEMEEEEDIWSAVGHPQFSRGDEEEREDSHRRGSEGSRRGGIGVGVVVAGGMISREDTKNEEGRGGRGGASRRRRMWGASKSKSIEEGLPLPNDESVGRQWERISIGIDAMEDGCIGDVIAEVSGERRFRDRRNRVSNIQVIEEGENQEIENEEEVLGKNTGDKVTSDTNEEVDEKGYPISESHTGTEASEGKEAVDTVSVSGEELKNEGDAEESRTVEETDIKICEKDEEVGKEEKRKEENYSQERIKRRGMFEESWWASTKSSGEGDIRVEELRMDFISTIQEESWGPASLEEEGVEAMEEDIANKENNKSSEDIMGKNIEEEEGKNLADDKQESVTQKMTPNQQSAHRTCDVKDFGQLSSPESIHVTVLPKPNDLNECNETPRRADECVTEVHKEENIDEAEEAKELEEEDCKWGQDPSKSEVVAGILDTEKQDHVKVKEENEGSAETKCAEHTEKPEIVTGATKRKTRSSLGIGDWDWYMDDEQEEEETPPLSVIPKELESKREMTMQNARIGGEDSKSAKQLEDENSGEWEFVDTGKQEGATGKDDGGTDYKEEFESNYIYTKGTEELLLGTSLQENEATQFSGAFGLGMERVSDLLGSFADIPADSETVTKEGTSPKREGEDLFRMRIALDEWEGIKGSENVGPETEVIVGEFDLLGDWGDAGGAIGFLGGGRREEIIRERKVESEESISLDSLEEPQRTVEGSSNLSENAAGIEVRENISEYYKSSKEAYNPRERSAESNDGNKETAQDDMEDIEVIKTPGWEEASERNSFPKGEYRTPFRDLEDMMGTSFTFKTISCRAQFNLWPSEEAFGGQGGQGAWMEHIDMDAFMNAAQSSQQYGVGEGLLANMTTFTKTCTTGNSNWSTSTTEQHIFPSADKKEVQREEEKHDPQGEEEEEDIVLEEQDFDDRSDELIPTVGRPPVHNSTYQSFHMESHPRRQTGDAFLIFESPGITMFSPLEGDAMNSDDEEDRVEGLERFGEVVQGHDEEVEGVELGGEWEEGVIYLDEDDEEDGRVVGRRGSGEYEKFGDEVVGRVEKEIWEMIHQEAGGTSSNEMAFAVVMEPEEMEMKQKTPVHPTGRWCPRLSMISPAMSAISEEEGEEALSYKEEEGRTGLESGESDDKSNYSFGNERNKTDNDTEAEFLDAKEELPDEHLRDYIQDKDNQKTQMNNGDSVRNPASVDVEDGFGEPFSRRRSSTSSGVSDIGAEAPADCGAAFVVSSELAVTLALGISITQIIPSAIDLPEIPPMPKVDEATEAISTLDVITRKSQQPRNEDDEVTKSNNHAEKDRERQNAQLTSSGEDGKSAAKSYYFDPKEAPSGSEYGSNATSSEENSMTILETPKKNIETQTEPVIVMTDIKELVENGIVVKEDLLLSICDPAAIRKQENTESNSKYKLNTHQSDFMLLNVIGQDERVVVPASNLEGATSTTPGRDSIKTSEKTRTEEPKNSAETIRRDEWDANETRGSEEKRGPSRKNHFDLVLNNTTDEGGVSAVGTKKETEDKEAAKNKNHRDSNSFEKELIETVEKDRGAETQGTKDKDHIEGTKKGKAILKGWEENWYAEEDEDDSLSPVSLVTSAVVVEDTKGGEIKGRRRSSLGMLTNDPEKTEGQKETTSEENNSDSQSSDLYSPPGGAKKKELPKQKSKESPPRKIPLEKLLGWPSESFSMNGNGAGCSGVASRRESVFDDYHFNMSGFDVKGDPVNRRVKTQDSTGLEYYLDVDQLLNVPLEATEPEVKYVSAKEIMDSFSRGIGIDSPEKTGENQSLGGREAGAERSDCSGSDGETSGVVPVDSSGGEDAKGGSKVNLGDKGGACVRDSFGPWDGDYFADEAMQDDILSFGTDHSFLSGSPQSTRGTPAELLFEENFSSDDFKMGAPTKYETPQANDPNQEGASANLISITKEDEPKREPLLDLGRNDIVELRGSEKNCDLELRKCPKKQENDAIESGTEKQGGEGSSGRSVRSIIDIFENTESPAQKKDTLPGKRNKGVESLITLFGEKTPNEKTADGRGEPAEVAPTEFPETKAEARKNEDAEARGETESGAEKIEEAESVHDEEKVLPQNESADLINVGEVSVEETLVFKEKEGDGTDETREKIIALEELGTDSSSKERNMQLSEEGTTGNTPTLKRTNDIFKSLPEEPVVGWEAIKVASEVEKIILESGNGIERNKKIMGGITIGPEPEELFHMAEIGEGSSTVIKREVHRNHDTGENKLNENEEIRGEVKENKDVGREKGGKLIQRPGFSSSLEEYRMAVSEAYGFLDSIGDAIDEDEEWRGKEGNQSNGGSEREDTSRSYGSESDGGRLTSDAEDSLERTFRIGTDTQIASNPPRNKAITEYHALPSTLIDTHTTSTPEDESTKSVAITAEKAKDVKEKGKEEVASKRREGKTKSGSKSSGTSAESGVVSTGDSLEEEIDEDTLAKMSVASRKVYWDRRLKKVEEKNKEPAVVTTVTRRPMKISGIVARGRMSFERSGMRDESITSDSGGSGGKSSSESSPSSEEKSRKFRRSPLHSKPQKCPSPPTNANREKKSEEAPQEIDSQKPKDPKIVEAVDLVSGEINREDDRDKNSAETKEDAGESIKPSIKDAQDTPAASKIPVSKRKEMWNEKVRKNSQGESHPLSFENRRIEMEKSTSVESTKTLPGKLSAEDKNQNKPSSTKPKATVSDSNHELEESSQPKEFVSSEVKEESAKEVKKVGPVKSTGSVSRLAKLFSAPPEPPPPTINRKTRPPAKFKMDKTDNIQGVDKASVKGKEETSKEMNIKKKETTSAPAQEKLDTISSTLTVIKVSEKDQGEGAVKLKESSKASNEIKQSGVVRGKFSVIAERRPSLHDTGKSSSLPVEGITTQVEGFLGARKQKYLESTKQRSCEGDVGGQVSKIKTTESEDVLGKAGMRKVRNMWERRASLESNNSMDKGKKPFSETDKRTGSLSEKKKTAQGNLSSKKSKFTSEVKDDAREQKTKPTTVEQTEKDATTTISPKMSQRKSVSPPPKVFSTSSSKPNSDKDTKIENNEDTSKQTLPKDKLSSHEEHPEERLKSSQDKGEEEMRAHEASDDKKGIPMDMSIEKDVPEEERKAHDTSSMQNIAIGKNRETSSRERDVDSNWKMKSPDDKNISLEKTALDSKPTSKQVLFDGPESEYAPKKTTSRDKKASAKSDSSPEKVAMERNGKTEKKSTVETKAQPVRTPTSAVLPRKKRLAKTESWDSWEEDAMDSISRRGKRDSLEIRVTDDEDNCVMREITSVPRFFPKDKMETHEEEASQYGSEMEESPCPSPCLEREEEEEKLFPLPAQTLTTSKRRGMPARTISVQTSGLVASGRRLFGGGSAVPEEKSTPSEEGSPKTSPSLEKKNSSAQHRRAEEQQKLQPTVEEERELLNYEKAERVDGIVVASITVGNVSIAPRGFKTKETGEESEEMFKAMPIRVMADGDHRRPDICVVVGPEEAKTSALEGDEGGDDGRSAISRRAAKGKAPAQKKPPPSAASSPDSESDGVPGAKLGGFLSTPAAHIRRHSAVDVETLRAFSAKASEGGPKGSKGSLPTRRRGSGDLGSPAKGKEDESRKRFTRARQFFECLEKGKDSPPSGAEDNVPENVPPVATKKKTRGKASAEDGLKTASVGRRTAVKHRPPLRGIHDSSESTTESDKEKHYKRKGKKTSTERTHSAPGSEADSSEGTPQKHTAHRRKREKDIVLRSQKFGGSERQVRVSERFNVMDLFKDVAGPLSGGGSGRATPLGIPHQAAVLAALRSVEDVRSSEAASPYDMYRPMEAANDCEPSKETDENANAEAPTAEDEENNVSFQLPMTLCVKREYHAEYPHLPMTSPRHSRHRSSNTDLIPRNVLLQLDNNNQETTVTPKRRSIAELF